ncbi:uncharacterized protein LOC116918958 isoform X2 [Daphnia magna]|nr:uncharacterized protein LOC116918958 isoform X2 [Daphnia magna]
MNEWCYVNQHLWEKTATCEYPYFPIENCMNYMFILGLQNSANVTTVPIIQNSAMLKLTHDEDYPVKLTWKIDCNTTDHMNSVSVSFPTDPKYNVIVDARCNSTAKFCELRLAKAQIPDCIPHVIHVNQEKATLDVETYYAHAVHNLSVKVELADIQLEWNDPICPLGSSDTGAFYSLIVFETNTQQNAYNSQIDSSCIKGISRRRLTFNKNSANGCPGMGEALRFQSALKSCINYSINLVHPEKRNDASLKRFGSLPFVLQSLESREIQNLEIVDISSNGFQIKWEIPVRCKNVKNVVIPIKINNQMPIYLSLSDANTTCTDSTCVVNWEHRSNIVPCTNYSVKVGIDTVQIITLPPGAPVVNALSNSSFDGSIVEWHVPVDCLDFLSTPAGLKNVILEQQNTILYRKILPCDVALSEKILSMFNLYLFHWARLMSPSTHYRTFRMELPLTFLSGLKNKVALISVVQQSSVGIIQFVKTPKILGWQILIRKMEVIATRRERDLLKQTVPRSFLVPIIAIVILLLVAFIIAFVFLRMQRREAIQNQTEVNNSMSTTESRNRVTSISRSRLPSFNFNRISSNSRQSSMGNAEDDLNTLPQMTKRPLFVRDLCSFDAGQARMEFFLINKLTEIEAKKLARTMAERPENKIKNRFLNTHPYDFNRVVLSHSEERQNDSYINASFIPGFDETKNEYIAAQGPKENTVGDFWRMIWEQKVKLIAMVTSLHECGKKKCEKYWPDQGESVVYGDLKLELVNESVNSFYTARNILISKSSDLWREIQQFHFTAWPDFEIPEQPEQLIRFIEIVRREARQLNSPSPIVVHCSAGVGRTGTFIALDYLIQQVLITDVVDVPRTVRHLRRFRTSMVQSEAQYIFLYTCIAHYVKTRLSSNGGQM